VRLRLDGGADLGALMWAPASIPLEPILRGIRDVGYYVWREGVPHGTTRSLYEEYRQAQA